MTFNRFWCNKCKKESQENEVEKRNVDTMFGDGRWWYCRTCGNALERYPEIGEKEQQIISRVRQSLAYIQKFGKPESIDETCRLLLDVGLLYREHGNTIKASLVLFNASDLAAHNNLSELATSAGRVFEELAYKFRMYDQDVVSPQCLFEQFIAYFIPE